MITTLLAAGLLLAPSANAFWRLPCAAPVLNSRVDPIISPGKASGHAHTIMGSSAIGLDTTFEDLRSSNCTTCMVTDDKSAYWVPELYYQYANKSFQAVTHGGALIYYLQRNAANETVEAFPDGLRMFTGNPYARSDPKTDESRGISWLCITDGPAQAQTPGFGNTGCTTALRAQVFFPACWDGVNLDSPDHKSHMAYPDGIDNGQCPYTHPHHLVSLFFEIWFYVAPFNALNDGGRFVLSNGDPTGYGLHGDFMNGWDHDVLSRAVKTCTAASGVIEDCPVFNNEKEGDRPNRFEDPDLMNSCAAKNPLPDELVGPGNILANLPGCVAVTEGPGPASAADLVPGCVVGGGGSSSPAAASSGSAPAASSSAAPAMSSGPASVMSSSTPLSGSASSSQASSSSVPSANNLVAATSPGASTTSSSASATASASAGAMGHSSSWASSWTSSYTTSGAAPSQSPGHCARDHHARDEADSVLAHRRSRIQRKHRSH